MNNKKAQQPQAPQANDKKSWVKPVLYSHDLSEIASGASSLPNTEDEAYFPTSGLG